MKKNPKVFIYLQSYSCENYIRRALDSILNQTYKNLQIILIDDGSKDSTFDIIKKWLMTDSRIEYYYQENISDNERKNLLLPYLALL